MCLLVPVEAGTNKPRTPPAATNITLQSVFNKQNSCPGNLLKIHLVGGKTPARCDGELTSDIQTSKSQYKPTLALLLKVPRSLVSDVELSCLFSIARVWVLFSYNFNRNCFQVFPKSVFCMLKDLRLKTSKEWNVFNTLIKQAVIQATMRWRSLTIRQ